MVGGIFSISNLPESIHPVLSEGLEGGDWRVGSRKRDQEKERKMLPGRVRVAHASLFLLFLSFLNLGTRRNLALRLRLVKSVRFPCETRDKIQNR